MTETSSQRENKLYIGNVSSKLDSGELMELFSKYGKVIRMDLKEGYGFVLYETPRAAEEAIDHLNDYEVQGTQIKVQWARYSSYNSVRNEVTDFSKRERPREEPCVVCNMPGHWAKDCPESRGVDIRSGRCFRCGETGHLAKYCYSNTNNFPRASGGNKPSKFFNTQFDRADSPSRPPNDTQSVKTRGTFGSTTIRRENFRSTGNRDAATMDNRSHYYTERGNYHQSGYTPRFDTEERSRYDYVGRESGFSGGMGRYEQIPPAPRERGYEPRSGDRGYMAPSQSQQPSYSMPPRVENRVPYAAEPRSGRDYSDPRSYGNNGHGGGGYNQRPTYTTQHHHRGGASYGEAVYRGSFETHPTMPRSENSGYRRGPATSYGRGGGPVIRTRSRSPGYERHGAGGSGGVGQYSYGANTTVRYPPQQQHHHHHQQQQHGKVEPYYKKEERYSNYG